MGRMKDIAIDLITYEEGALDVMETLELFALLVKSGLVWDLQGSYGRMANELMHLGYLTADGRVTEFAESMAEELVAT
jgi:hypothetical protein